MYEVPSTEQQAQSTMMIILSGYVLRTRVIRCTTMQGIILYGYFVMIGGAVAGHRL